MNLADLRARVNAVPGLPEAIVWGRVHLGNRGYRRWIATAESDQKVDLAGITFAPLISIVVPAFNTPKRYLDELVASVRAQRYDRWELILADASNDRAARRRLEALARTDKRIHHVPLADNAGIAGNTNAGLAAAHGEYVAFLDHDDTLAPDALAGAVRALQSEPRPQILYSDEDKLTDDGRHRLLPVRKPAFDLKLLQTYNYLNHFVMVERELTERLGGIRTGFDGAQDYDFLLRAIEAAESPPVRVPLISYHWRMVRGSTARHAGQKADAIEAGRRALQEHLDRTGADADAVTPVKDAAEYWVVPRPA